MNVEYSLADDLTLTLVELFPQWGSSSYSFSEEDYEYEESE